MRRDIGIACSYKNMKRIQSKAGWLAGTGCTVMLCHLITFLFTLGKHVIITQLESDSYSAFPLPDCVHLGKGHYLSGLMQTHKAIDQSPALPCCVWLKRTWESAIIFTTELPCWYCNNLGLSNKSPQYDDLHYLSLSLISPCWAMWILARPERSSRAARLVLRSLFQEEMSRWQTR